MDRQTTAVENQPHDLASLCLAFTEHAPLPMATVEGAAHIVSYVNPAFCSLMDRRPEQIFGKPLSELLPANDHCVTLLDRVFLTGRPQSHTEQEQLQAHPLFWAYSIWPVLAEERLVGIMIQVTETARFHGKAVAMNEALMLGAVRQHALAEAADRLNAKLELEISGRKRAQKALSEAKAALADEAVLLERLVAARTAELTSINRQLEAFVYTIAHDLRAPLRSMTAFSDMLVKEEPSLTESGQDYARRIKKSARFMDSLLTDLLAFSHITQEGIVLGQVNLQTSVHEALARLEKEIQEKNGRVEAPGPWPSVLAHAPTLNQVLFNLLNNALKFGRPGVPPLIRIWTDEARLPAANSNHSSLAPAIRVWIEDNGVGIAPEHYQQIFSLFLQLQRDVYEGTGVGLAIVKTGIERMGGRVGVDSTPGQGSRFWFELKKPQNGFSQDVVSRP
jgi:signal transduction histidine kinase